MKKAVNLLLIIVITIIIIKSTITILLINRTKKQTTNISELVNNINSINTGNESIIDKINTCNNSSIEIENFTDEMKNKLEEIENLFKSSNLSVSFSYEDMQTGLHIGYNEEKKYFTASVIKSPVVLYIYMMNLNNEIDLNETMVYTPDFYMGGTGTIQYEPLYTSYSIKNLISKTIIESDNIAYAMLCSKVPKEKIKNFYHEKGATTFWEQNSEIWGEINSKDGAIYMKELYNFIKKHPELKQDILDKYTAASLKLITLNNEDTLITHKSGWTDAAIHDMAIIYNEHPYVLSINTSLGNNNFIPFFNKATNLINEFHELYWKQKPECCYKTIFK